MTSSDEKAPPLEVILRELHRQGRLGTLTFHGGAGQANHCAPGQSSWRVRIDEDPVKAITAALGPKPGKTWDEHLKVRRKADVSDLI